MTPLIRQPRRVRVLRNLSVNEISGVDRGAGRGVKILLMKKESAMPTVDTTMPAIDINKAGAAYGALFDLRKIQNPTLSASKVHDLLLRDPVGRDLFALSNLASQQANDPNRPVIAKGLVEGGPGMSGPGMDSGGRVVSGTARTGHSVARTVYATDLKIPQGDASAEDQWNEYLTRLIGQRGISRGAAIDEALRSPGGQKLWAAFKAQGSPRHQVLPPSHDANANRVTA